MRTILLTGASFVLAGMLVFGLVTAIPFYLNTMPITARFVKVDHAGPVSLMRDNETGMCFLMSEYGGFMLWPCTTAPFPMGGPH